HPPSARRRSGAGLRRPARRRGAGGWREAWSRLLECEGHRGYRAAPRTGNEMPASDLVDVALVEQVEHVEAERRAGREIVGERRVDGHVVADLAVVGLVGVARADVAQAAADLEADRQFVDRP